MYLKSPNQNNINKKTHMYKTKLKIEGMHCVSCEMILEKEFKKIPGLSQCKVNHKKGDAEIVCDKYLPASKFRKIVEACGYSLSSDERSKTDSTTESLSNDDKKLDILLTILIALGFGAIIYIINELDLMKFLPNFGSQINVGIALILGVVASLSTCLALTGGIVMSFGSLVHIHEGRKHHLLARAMPHIYFHIGRVGGFAILGGLLGLLGSKLNYSPGFTGYFTILIAIVMFYIGLQILGFVPNITKLGFHLPKSLSSKIDNLQNSNHHLMPILIGVFTFFLPCGFTQSMQLAAVASQSFLTGALIMSAFALGTLPVLLSVGIGSTYAHKNSTGLFYKIVGVVIVFFALYSFNSGLVLAGSSFTLDFWSNSSDSKVAEQVEESGSTGSAGPLNEEPSVQVVKMDVDWSFSPTEFTVKKGVPVRWEINGINVSGCSNEIVIPKLKISKKINKGLNIVEFTPESAGTLPFSCWMGMLTGKFNVTE